MPLFDPKTGQRMTNKGKTNPDDYPPISSSRDVDGIALIRPTERGVGIKISKGSGYIYFAPTEARKIAAQLNTASRDTRRLEKG